MSSNTNGFNCIKELKMKEITFFLEKCKAYLDNEDFKIIFQLYQTHKDEIIKNELKTFDDKEYIVSESTNEMIKLGINLEKLKENIIAQENVEALNLNVNLKIKNFGKTEINDSIINELVTSKKREIYKSFPKCFFYPIFIKDIKINFIHLLANNKLKEKIFYPDFSNFYVTVFNEKNNRFFAILCLA